MLPFTPLETHALRFICEAGVQLTAAQREALWTLLNTASLVERENTGHGFYTAFQVDRTLGSPLGDVSMINGPSVALVGHGEGNRMDFILWAEGGFPSTLEGFQHGDLAGETVDLRQVDLAALQFQPT
ncbi:hypothetical protein [Brevundimonas sp.]|uniref:hypothetical protein n=1 Tax=Brevundimonas sp. TaxID=1871086 RepID=UPI0025D4F5CA|nr:hypothetical protein [Brevundimonas sp.]